MNHPLLDFRITWHNEMYSIALYHRHTRALSKHSDRIRRDGQVCIIMTHIWLCKAFEKPVQMVKEL